MFEYTVETDVPKIHLTSLQKSTVAQNIGSLFDEWDSARSKQKEIAEKLHAEIYLDDRGGKYYSEDDDWKSDLHLNKIYSLFQTQQAYIWDNIYANIENLFDVDGLDERSAQTASLQKQKLIKTLYKIGIQRKLDKAIEHLGSIGEACLFIGWHKKYKSLRRLKESLPESISHSLSDGPFGIIRKEVYNGATVEVVNPLLLAFDPKVQPEESEKWDSCGKIIKSWETYSAVSSNKLYRLTDEELSEIRRSLALNSLRKNRFETQTSSDVIDENRIEVLQYWGDYTLDDGTVLKNWHAVVIGRRYLARFEPNRWVINPLINVALFRDSESHRGLPELWSIYDLCKEQENKVNLQNDAQMLNLNPPAYAPEGFFKEENVKLFPGKQVAYKPGLDDPSSIIRMNFPLIKNEDIIQYYDSTASNVSGIFPNMQGQQEFRNVTATEINIQVQGQTTRLGKTLDTIKQNLIVPMIEKIADLEANMKFGSESVFVRTAEGLVARQIDDAVRQGSYEYRYTDNSGIRHKLSLNAELSRILTPFWNDPNVPLNKIEIVKEALKNAGIENTEKFLLPVSTTPQGLNEPINDNQTGDTNAIF